MATRTEDALLTAPQVASVLGKSSETVLRMARLGRLPVAERLTGRNGMVLFSRDAIRDIAAAEVDRITEALRRRDGTYIYYSAGSAHVRRLLGEALSQAEHRSGLATEITHQHSYGG